MSKHKLRFYDIDKLEALANHLGIPVDGLIVWSDNSITVRADPSMPGEYYVTKRPRKHGTNLGISGGYTITRSD